VRLNRVFVCLLAVLVRRNGVFFGFLVSTMAVLMGSFLMVVSRSRMVCGGGQMMFNSRMFCFRHDLYPPWKKAFLYL